MKALICGSFDPVTNGHLDLIKRTAALFDSVTVGIFINPDKKYFFDLDTRIALLTEATEDIKNVSVDTSEGLVAKYVEAKGIDAIVKGVRNTADYEYELEMARINKSIFSGAETILLPASDGKENLSSSGVKALFFAGEDISALVPSCVKRAFDKKQRI